MSLIRRSCNTGWAVGPKVSGFGELVGPPVTPQRVTLPHDAIRSAHNLVSRATLDACDRLGVLVMDELIDVWTKSKTSFDYALAFPEWWERDVVAMVAKDCNHPRVIMSSIGNEIFEVGTPIGSSWGRRLAETIRALDDTRLCHQRHQRPGSHHRPARRATGRPGSRPADGRQRDDGRVGEDDEPAQRLRSGHARHRGVGRRARRRPLTEKAFGAASCTTYDGRALAIIRPLQAGAITVTVSADGCDSRSITVHAEEPALAAGWRGE